MDDWRRSAARGELKVGTTVRFSRTFTAEDVSAFGRLTRDYNPVHDEARWCELKGYRAPICHGLLVGSMLCQPGGQWGWLATSMSFRFRRPVYIGDTVSCELRIVEMGERGWARGVCTLRNQRGEPVLEAELRGYLPEAPERALLAELGGEGTEAPAPTRP